jgi:hypothetical protein
MIIIFCFLNTDKKRYFNSKDIYTYTALQGQLRSIQASVLIYEDVTILLANVVMSWIKIYLATRAGIIYFTHFN